MNLLASFTSYKDKEELPLIFKIIPRAPDKLLSTKGLLIASFTASTALSLLSPIPKSASG